jgi:FkbM family methyltransferase
MNKLTKLTKAAVMANRTVADLVYRGRGLLRARRASRSGASSFGQSGEDAWFLAWLQEQGIPWANDGFYLDIGANHPVVMSATYLLYREGWQGITVEPIPDLCTLHTRLRRRDICLNVGVGAQSGFQTFWETAPDYFCSFSQAAAEKAEADGLCRVLRRTDVKVSTPQEIIAHVPSGRRINYVSIDTEGLDTEILKNWPWTQCRPDLISCEASADHASEARRLLREVGYQLVKDFPVTAFWKSPDFSARFSAHQK